MLGRLKRGFSFTEAQKQFAQNYTMEPAAARNWVNWACDQIAEEETPASRRRTHNIFIEMLHDQIVQYQTEILAMQREVDAVAAILDRRNTIVGELEAASGQRHRELLLELTALPPFEAIAKANLIEAKTRIRERMYRVMSDLARIRGVGVGSDWRAALNTLLDNNLIPPSIASGILSVIDDFENSIRSVEEAPDDLATDPET